MYFKFSNCTVAGCGRRHLAKGFCSMHYDQRQRQSQQPLPPSDAEVARFWAKVQKTTDSCWYWQGAKCQGYGYFRPSKSRRLVRAHVYAYSLLRGAVPNGLILDHLCRVRACVNPAHLEAVTNRENTRRGFKARLVNNLPNSERALAITTL